MFEIHDYVKLQHHLTIHYLLSFVRSLYRAIPEDSRRTEYKEAVAKAQAKQETLASKRDSESEAAASKHEDRKKAPSEDAAATASPVKEAQASLENLLSTAKLINTDSFWEKFSTQLAQVTTPRTSLEKEPKAQIATVRGQEKAKKLAPQIAIVKPAAEKVKPQLKQQDPKPEVRPVFGGLFKQETVYVDDD